MEITGEFIKQERERRGWTQEELAQRTNQSLKTITNHETGSTITRNKADIYRKVFDVKGTVNEPNSEYTSAANITLRQDIIHNKEELYTLIKFLKRNQEILMKDELWALYCEFIHSELEVEKSKQSLRELIAQTMKKKGKEH